MENDFEFGFVLLEDGSLSCTAAKLTDQTKFDSSIRFGSENSLGSILINVPSGGGGEPVDPNTVAVTFEANGGYFSNQSNTLLFRGDPGQPITGYQEPIREDTTEKYSFLGWGLNPKDPTVDEDFSMSDPVFPGSDTYYYALWAVEQKRWLIFDYNNDNDFTIDNLANLPEKMEILEGGSLSNKLPAPTSTTYAFNGWYDENGSKIYNDTKFAGEEDITVTASWSEIFTITFTGLKPDDKGKTIREVTTGSFGQLPYSKWVQEYELTKEEGKSLLYWSTSENGPPTTQVSTSTIFNSNTTLYPVFGWKIELDYSSGLSSVTGAGTPYCAVESLVANPDGTLTSLPIASCSGATFNGWYKGTTTSDQVKENVTTFSGSTTIFAQWSSPSSNSSITVTLYGQDYLSYGGSNLPVTLNKNTVDFSEYYDLTNKKTGKQGHVKYWLRFDSGEKIPGQNTYVFGESCSVSAVEEMDEQLDWSQEIDVESQQYQNPFGSGSITCISKITIGSGSISTTEDGTTYASMDLRQETDCSWAESGIAFESTGEEIGTCSIALPIDMDIFEFGGLGVSYWIETIQWDKLVLMAYDWLPTLDDGTILLAPIIYLKGSYSNSSIFGYSEMYIGYGGLPPVSEFPNGIKIGVYIGINATMVQADSNNVLFEAGRYELHVLHATNWEESSGLITEYEVYTTEIET